MVVTDAEAPIPYIRDPVKAAYEVPTVKLVHDMNPSNPKKFTLKKYSASEQEDGEHFLEAFEHFLRQMRKLGMQQSIPNMQPVPKVFEYFEDVLDGNALTDWSAVLGSVAPNSNTWRDFKHYVARYIQEKVFQDPDCYNTQKDYIMTRSKPPQKSVPDFAKRFTTVNRYMPYLLTRSQLQFISDGRYKLYSDLWQHGQLTEAQQISAFKNACPQLYQLKFEERGYHHQTNLTFDKVVQYMTDIEAAEIKLRRYNQLRNANRAPGRFAGGGRRPNRSYQRGNPNVYGQRGPPYYRGSNYQQRFNNYQPNYNNYQQQIPTPITYHHEFEQ